MTRARLAAAARAALLALAAVASLYALLCFLPFSWINFLRDRRYPHWVELFLRVHLALFLLIAALGAAALRGRSRNAWAAAAAAFALASAASGGLAARGPGLTSLMWAFATWLPYFAWELALANSPPSAGAAGGGAPSGPRAVPTVSAALFCAAVYGVADALTRGFPAARLPGAGAAAWSLVVHLELFLAAALALDALGAAARLSRRARAEDYALRAALWLAGTRGLIWIFSSLSFSGPAAWAYSGLACAAGLTALARSESSRRESSPLARTLGPVRAAARAAAASPARRAAALAAMAAFPWAARALIGGADWNRLFESLAAVGLWIFAAAFFHELPRRGRLDETRARRALWGAAAAALALAWGAQAAALRWAAPLRLSRAGLAPAVRRLESGEISLATARRLLRRPGAGDDFDAFLQENTNLPRRPGRGSRNLELVKDWGAPPPHPPHLFILVVDSLRAYYVGAYNPKVRFTPALDAFAKESVVFARAFTAYGGTGLSEPSIWAGARLPHMQYPSPFPPMNALEKLVDRDGYRPLITMDAILTELLKPDKNENALDKTTYGNYKLCPTLDELEGRLDRELASGRPLFVYTQPQDIHISVIQREGARPVSVSPDFDGFYAPYASRVAALDACIGRFLAILKEKKLDDDSIVVLTADHGDSLGEDGRWGHAYTIFPEILRVPLIVRVPGRLLAGRYWNPAAAAYLTDLAPTLDSLLGHEPDAPAEPFGRPLFARSREEFDKDTRPARVVASSYGPVYGLLTGAGRSLVVFDGVNRASSVFDLDKDPAGLAPRSDPAAEASAEAEIRASLTALRGFYGY